MAYTKTEDGYGRQARPLVLNEAADGSGTSHHAKCNSSGVLLVSDSTLGTPAGVSVSADIAAVKADTAAIKAVTDVALVSADIQAAAAAALVAAAYTRSAGVQQVKPTTMNLNQAAGTYDLLTGTTQDVLIEKLDTRMPTGAAGGALTSVSIQTNDATPAVLISTTLGAVANLTSEAHLGWPDLSSAPILLKAGKKIQYTIAGGAHGSAYAPDVVVLARAVVTGGYLA